MGVKVFKLKDTWGQVYFHISYINNNLIFEYPYNTTINFELTVPSFLQILNKLSILIDYKEGEEIPLQINRRCIVIPVTLIPLRTQINLRWSHSAIDARTLALQMFREEGSELSQFNLANFPVLNILHLLRNFNILNLVGGAIKGRYRGVTIINPFGIAEVIYLPPQAVLDF